jgi:hypothetical protein
MNSFQSKYFVKYNTALDIINTPNKYLPWLSKYINILNIYYVIYIVHIIYGYCGKVVSLRAKQAQRGGRGTARPVLVTCARSDSDVSAIPPAALPPKRRPGCTETWVALSPVWIDPKNLAATGFRTPDRLALSKSLYRLRSPGPMLDIVSYYIVLYYIVLYYIILQFTFHTTTGHESPEGD